MICGHIYVFLPQYLLITVKFGRV